MKKAKGKKRSAKKSASKKPAVEQKPVDIIEVRKQIQQIVGNQATSLVEAVLGEGAKGQVSPVKYLFDLTGISAKVPEPEQEEPEKEYLAHMLLKRLGIPIEPVHKEEEDAPLRLLPEEGTEVKQAEPAQAEQPNREAVPEENTQEQQTAGAEGVVG